MRQAEEVAHDRGHGRPTPPAGQKIPHGATRAATNVGGDFAREVEEIVIDEKKAAELMVLDELQLFREPAQRWRMVERARRVALLHAGVAQLGQRLRSGRATRAAKVGKGVAEVARQVEGLAALGDSQCHGDSIRTVIEQRNDFVQWPQAKFAVRISHPMRAIERGAMPDGNHHILQPVQLACVVEHVARRHDGKLHLARDFQQRARHGEISADTVALDFDEEPLTSKDVPAVRRPPLRGAVPLGFQDTREQAVPARSRKNDESVLSCFDLRERQLRIKALGAEVRLGK